MKTKSLLLLLLSLSQLPLCAQNSAVYKYFDKGIARIVKETETVEASEDASSNHVYSRLFSSPVLYEGVVSNAFAGNGGNEGQATELLAMDDRRSAVIDDLMLDLYASHPEKVAMTEKDLRNEVTPMREIVDMAKVKISKLDMKLPENVAGGMPTTVVKPNYWKFSGRTSLTFTQNFISENWYQGGESNYSMLASIDLDLNYDDKDRITWTNHFDLDLGFATSQADTVHSFRTNTDKIRIESTFGYKLVKHLDLAAKLKVESQMLPNYPINTRDFISNCLAPLDANASIGLNYKPDLGKFKLEIYLAPLSAFNFRYVHYERLAQGLGVSADNGFDLGRGRARQDFGTQLVVTVPTYQLTSFLDVYSRLEYYTDYHRAFFQWETKFNAALSKYFTASLMLNARFDDSVAMHEDWKLWQLKELFTLGVAYSW